MKARATRNINEKCASLGRGGEDSKEASHPPRKRGKAKMSRLRQRPYDGCQSCT